MSEPVGPKKKIANAPVGILRKTLTGRAQAQVRRPLVRSGTIRRLGAGGLRGGIGFVCVVLGIGSATYAPAGWQVRSPVKKGAVMTMHASGMFEVNLKVQKADSPPAESANLGRMSIEKQYHGELEATSAGEMLSAGTEVKGSAGYVAMERVDGTLHGLTGTFVLQHSGTMTRGEPQLSVSVVPDSGTGQLAGITGKLSIQIAGGKHFYEFDYSLPETP